jgi:hypothetical protein
LVSEVDQAFALCSQPLANQRNLRPLPANTGWPGQG